MKAITQGNGCYWRMDGPVPFWFNEVDGRDPEPTTILCSVMHDTLSGGVITQRRVDLDAMTFLGAGLYSDERVAATGVTGQSHRFGVFEWRESRPRGIVIIVCHGGGMRCYLIETPRRIESWQAVCKALTQDQLWDLCHSIVDAYEAGLAVGRNKAYRLFLDGRLKKRKRNGSVTVDVIPAKPEAA